MVLGAHQICTDACEFKSLCCSKDGVWEMDNACPVYKDGRDNPYLHLSNGNRIEMDAYIEDAANYPAYSSFTKYMLSDSSGYKDMGFFEDLFGTVGSIIDILDDDSSFIL